MSTTKSSSEKGELITWYTLGGREDPGQKMWGSGRVSTCCGWVKHKQKPTLQHDENRQRGFKKSIIMDNENVVATYHTMEFHSAVKKTKWWNFVGKWILRKCYIQWNNTVSKSQTYVFAPLKCGSSHRIFIFLCLIWSNIRIQETRRGLLVRRRKKRP